MKNVSTTQQEDRLNAIVDDAQREPVVIRRENRDVAVVLSIADYKRLRAANVEALLRLQDEISAKAAARGLTEERLNELLADDDA
jgi:prevent-host-death family protein